MAGARRVEGWLWAGEGVGGRCGMSVGKIRLLLYCTVPLLEGREGRREGCVGVW